MQDSEQKHGAKRLRPESLRTWVSKARPGQVALLWLISAALRVADALFFPEATGGVSWALFLAGTPIFSGLLAGWALRLRTSALPLIALFCAMEIFFGIIWMGYELDAALQSEATTDWWIVAVPSLLALILILWFGYARRSRRRRVAAIAIVLGTNILMAAVTQFDPLFWRASAQAQALLHPDVSEEGEDVADAMSGIEPDRLWEAQSNLLTKAVDGLPPRIAGRPNVYAIAIAAQGSQQLFSREARLAIEVAAARFGSSYRGGILLSNGVADLLRGPLATQGNVAAAARGVANRIDPARDVTIVYLASHGSRDAWLSTDLPDYQTLRPISSASLAAALSRAGIRRRIVIVSACYSASWIPPLSNDDTIVIAAAAKDRTSFGCSDKRTLTYFGEAFLQGPLARGASLRDAFEGARRTLARWEAKEKLTPSMPQAYVGRNMQAFWAERAPSRELVSRVTATGRAN